MFSRVYLQRLTHFISEHASSLATPAGRRQRWRCRWGTETETEDYKMQQGQRKTAVPTAINWVSSQASGPETTRVPSASLLRTIFVPSSSCLVSPRLINIFRQVIYCISFWTSTARPAFLCRMSPISLSLSLCLDICFMSCHMPYGIDFYFVFFPV